MRDDSAAKRLRVLGAVDTDIRHRMLGFIKAHDGAYVQDVAGHFEITHEGARKQLVRMEQDGWLSRQPSTDGVGRPRDAYAVTVEADHLLPKAYGKLSAALMAHLSDGPTSLRETLAALARSQVAAWKPLLEGKTLPEKLEALRSLYAEDDPFTSVEYRDGAAYLVERNCPFLNVALEHPALCSLTVNTLEELLGHTVRRKEKFQAGQGRCVFQVGAAFEHAGGAFELEAERASAA